MGFEASYGSEPAFSCVQKSKIPGQSAYLYSLIRVSHNNGVVGCGEGVMYLTSFGHPTDVGLPLGKACCPCTRIRVEGEYFYFFCVFTFIPVPLSSLSPLSSPLLSLFSISLGDDIK